MNLGKQRRLAKCLTTDGHLFALAIDHRKEFAELLPGGVDSPFAEMAAAKKAVIDQLAEPVSAVLVDPEAAGALLAGGAIPANRGFVTALEDETYTFPNGPRGSVLRADWSVAQSADMGADLLKILWFYRPDLDEDLAREQRDLLTQIHRESEQAGLPVIVEPIWYATENEDPKSAEWLARRDEGVVLSAQHAVEAGTDLLKIEFPGRLIGCVDEAEGEAARVADEAAQRCQQITDSCGVPWVLLSAGVTFPQFVEQLKVSGRAGCAGYMAGRAIWSDCARKIGQEGQAHAIAEAADRLDLLNATIRTAGGRIQVGTDMDTAIKAWPADWYRG